MFKKITCFVFAFILVFTNATSISAVKLETNILNKNGKLQYQVVHFLS